MARRAKKRTRPQAGTAPPTPPANAAPQCDHPAESWQWRRHGLLAGVLFAAAIAVYANSFWNGDVYDDRYLIRANERLADPWNLRTFFGDSYTGEPFRDGYRPLTLWSFALDRALFGNTPFGTHGHNILLNALLAVLVFLFLWRLLRSGATAFIAAMIFTLHPAHTEIVANGAGRAELLCTLFMIGGAACHLEGLLAVMANRRGALPVAGLAGGMCCYLGGLLSKETATTLPGLLFLMEWLVLRRGDFAAMLRGSWRYFAYLLPLAVYLAARFSVLGTETPPPQGPMVSTTRWQIFLYANDTMVRYIGQTVFPLWLQGEYTDFTKPFQYTLLSPMVLASMVMWSATAALCVWLFRRGAHVAVFGIAWYFLALLPASNLVILVASIRGDRFLFVPSLGVAICLAVLAMHGLKKWKPVTIAVLVSYLAFFAVRTAIRNLDWRSEEIFWAKLLEQNPGEARCWYMTGKTLLEQGKNAEGEEHFRKGIELRALFGMSYPEAQSFHGVLLRNRGAVAEAEQEFRKLAAKHADRFIAHLNLAQILSDDPKRAAEGLTFSRQAIALEPKSGEAWLAHARLLSVTGNEQETGNAFRTAMQLGPKEGGYYAEAALHFALYYVRQEKNPEAEALYREMIARWPRGFPYQASTSLADLLKARGEKAEAESLYRRVVAEAPGYHPAKINLAQMLIESGGIDEAIPLLEEAVRLAPREFSGRFNLASAYRQRGELDKALEQIEEGCKARPDLKLNWDLKARILTQLDRAEEAERPVAADVEFVGVLGLGLLGQPQQRREVLGQVVVAVAHALA
ncbi:tetratricopeptide repeat protein, partial [Candidatus Poribacteria bacterium]|nr:tetratricopeptide repeat protein [Candidatus Poribacteria bacterium]